MSQQKHLAFFVQSPRSTYRPPWDIYLWENYMLYCIQLWLKMKNFTDAFLGVSAKLGTAAISFIMSRHLSAWNNSAQTGRMLMKLDI